MLLKVVTGSPVAHACFPTLHSCRSFVNYYLSGSSFGGFLTSSCSRALSYSRPHTLSSVSPFALVFGLQPQRPLNDKVDT